MGTVSDFKNRIFSNTNDLVQLLVSNVIKLGIDKSLIDVYEIKSGNVVIQAVVEIQFGNDEQSQIVTIEVFDTDNFKVTLPLQLSYNLNTSNYLSIDDADAVIDIMRNLT